MSGEARTEDDRDIGLDLQKLFRELNPGHVRHGMVGDDEVEAPRIGRTGYENRENRTLLRPICGNCD
jgi:hypothetical protein